MMNLLCVAASVAAQEVIMKSHVLRSNRNELTGKHVQQ
jgi:hypothetical protein